MSELINAGTVVVQRQHRVNIYRVCKVHGIAEGDPIEVWIRKVAKEPE